MPQRTGAGAMPSPAAGSRSDAEATGRNPRQGVSSKSSKHQTAEQAARRRDELVDRLQQMARDEAQIQTGSGRRKG
jgi:hypothetical protein